MKKRFYGIILIYVFLAFSCGNEHGTESQTEINQNANDTGSVPVIPAAQDSEKTGLTIAPPATGSNVATQAPSSNLNTPHGQPGHRCDIPEG